MATLEQRERPTSSLLVAADPAALVNAQHRMIEDVAHKIELAKIEATEAKLMAETMTAARLGSAQAKALHKRATSRVGYLVKIKQALEAGYCMMPDMEGTTIAVRLDQIGPMPAARVARRWAGNVPDERPRGLPAGQGDYFSPRQEMGTQNTYTGKDSAGKDKFEEYSYAVSLRDPDGIDRRFMRPAVMSRTVQAMALKLFDEIACVKPADTRRRSTKPDPIVLGRIVDPHNKRVSAFMIAWFIDTAEL